MTEILFAEESYKIIGACMAVHNRLGMGFLESVYQEALEREFKERKIIYISQPKLSIRYGNIQLSKYFKADYICYKSIIVEIKAVSFLSVVQSTQVLNYLRATELKLGLLVNFGESSLKFKRIVN